MGAFLNTKTLEAFDAVHSPDFQPPTWEPITPARATQINATIPLRYRKLGGADVVLMTQPERAVVDAAVAAAAIDAEWEGLDRADLRAMVEVLLDGLNIERARHGDGAVSWQQFKNQWRTKREGL